MKAFPVKGWNGHEETINEGMDLRDYFAAKALSVLYKQFSEFEDGFHCSDVATAAYQMADEMMKARGNHEQR